MCVLLLVDEYDDNDYESYESEGEVFERDQYVSEEEEIQDDIQNNSIMANQDHLQFDDDNDHNDDDEEDNSNENHEENDDEENDDDHYEDDKDGPRMPRRQRR